MPTLATLTESEVRRLVGDDLFQRADPLVRSGQVVERMRLEDGAVDAFVVDRRVSYNAHAFDEAGEILADCDCDDEGEDFCVHAAALLIAWARDRRSFEEDWPDEDEAADEAADADWEDAVPAVASPARAGRPDLTQPVDPRLDYTRLLSRLTLPQLREIAQRRGVPISGNRKDPIVETLAGALSRPEAVADAWPSLSRPARQLLGTMALVRAETGVHPSHAREAFRLLDAKEANRFDTLVDELSGFGLIFVTPYQTIEMPQLLPFHLPPDADFVAAHRDGAALRPVAPAPPPFDFALLAVRLLLALKAGDDRFEARAARQPHPQESRIIGLHGWPHDPADVEALVREQQSPYAIYNAPLAVLPLPSLLADEARDDLCRSAGVDADRADFALRLLSVLGLVSVKPGRPVRVDDDRFGEFLAQPPLTRALMLLAASASLGSWTELDRLASLRPGAPRLRRTLRGYDQGYAYMLTLLSAARSVLLWYIRRAPARQWVDFDAFVARARAFRQSPYFWPMTPNLTWHLELNGRVANAADAADWQATYGAFVETVLAGPLSWQGAVELAREGDRLVAFRITDFGARLMGQTSTFEAPDAARPGGPALSPTPDGDLLLRADAAQTETLNLITQLCEARADSRSQLIYRPTPAGASRLFEAGWTDASVIAALEKALQGPLPESLARTIRSWWANFGALHLYADVALIEFADDYALTELLAGTSLSQVLLYRFSPRLIAIRPEGVEALKADLVKRGYTPKVASDE